MSNFLRELALMLVALAAVLALAWLALRLLRGRLPGAAARAAADDETLRFVRALPVGTKERVVLMDHRGERWMLGVTAGGISLLARWSLGGAAPTNLPPNIPAIADDPSCGPP